MRLTRIKEALAEGPAAALVFFLQALYEQLYDRTDHSYRAPAVNTYTRTLELQVLANSNFKAGIGKEALRPFVEELKWSVSRDVALSAEQRALCQVHVDSALDSISEPDRIARSLAGLRISLGNYFDLVKKKIQDQIVNSPEKRGDLYHLASSFIVQAEAIGYPRRHTYHTLQRVGHGITDERLRDPRSIIEFFFSQFEGRAEHDCTLIVSSEASRMKDLMGRFGILPIEGDLNLGGLSARQANFAEIRSAQQIFVRIEGIKAPSVVRAAQVAGTRYSSFSAIVRSVDHEFDSGNEPLILVERKSDNKRFIVREDGDPMRRWSPSAGKNEEYMILLADAVHGKHLTEESKRRLLKAVTYHSSALDTSSVPHKLTTLWAGLEGLLSTPRKGMSRIDFFAECILPALSLNYPEYLLNSLMTRLYALPGVKEEIEGQVGGEYSELEKFARFTLCKEFDKKRARVTHMMGHNELLIRFRCFEVWTKLSSASAMCETISAHRRKVKWHIERVYSMRNSIMHDASALPYVEVLVENIHGYIDILVESIAKIAVAAEEAVSIESAILYMASLEKYRMEYLKGLSGARVSTSNIDEMIFGKVVGLNLDF
ncbi:hypothetical protein JY472_14995 [Stenotrophomonas maltophilia]|nr:hypothetical protein [Stenotrophomonas maltophilia]